MSVQKEKISPFDLVQRNNSSRRRISESPQTSPTIIGTENKELSGVDTAVINNQHHFKPQCIYHVSAVWIKLTFHRQPTFWWRVALWRPQTTFSLTFIKTFMGLGHLRDSQLLSGVILDEFAVFIEKDIRRTFLWAQLAAQSNRLSLHHRVDRTHQDNTTICENSQKWGRTVLSSWHAKIRWDHMWSLKTEAVFTGLTKTTFGLSHVHDEQQERKHAVILNDEDIL